MRRVALLVAAIGLAGQVLAAQPLRFQAERVVVFGDVHGAYENMEQLLKATGIVDDALAWRGGAAHLVSLGDLLDRGAESRKAMDLLIRLQQEAPRAGGAVHVVLGNHELMNMTGDLRYVSAGEYAAFADQPVAPLDGFAPGYIAHQQAFRQDGKYGSWLLAQPSVLIVNDTAFVHGGLPPLASTMSPEQLDTVFKTRLTELLTLRDELESAGIITPYQDVLASADLLEASVAALRNASDDAPAAPDPRLSEHLVSVQRFIELAKDDLFSDAGVLWYRGTAGCHDLLEQPVLDAALRKWDVNRVMVGHTPTPDHRVRQRFGGRAILADTGMLASFYGGQPAAVILEPGGKTPGVLYPLIGTQLAAPERHEFLELQGLPQARVLELLYQGSLLAEPLPDGGGGPMHYTVSAGEDEIMALFFPGTKSQVSGQLAAYALDRLLGLNLVAPTVAREVDGKRGVLSAVWTGALNEAERASGQRGLTNWCGRGSVFQLMYAFDALLQNDGRSPTNMLYDRATWRLLSVDHAMVFGRGDALPKYLQAAPHVLPQGVVAGFKALNEASLQAELGEYLSKRQILDLLRRRDAILATWTVEG